MYLADEVDSLNIDSCYAENVNDVMFSFQSYATATIDNCYLNFMNDANCYFLDYAETPRNDIKVGRGNHFGSIYSNDNYIKTVGSTYGYGEIYFESNGKEGTGLSGALIDNTKFPSTARFADYTRTYDARTGYNHAETVNKYAVGQYVGKYGDGGFDFVDTASSTLQLNTYIQPSSTSRIYVNLYVNGHSAPKISGVFVRYTGTSNWTFYQYDAAGLTLSTVISISQVGDYFQVAGTMSGTVTNTNGQIRIFVSLLQLVK